MLKDKIAEVLYGELTYKNYLAIPEVRHTADLKIDQIISIFNEELDEIENPYYKNEDDYADIVSAHIFAEAIQAMKDLCK